MKREIIMDVAMCVVFALCYVIFFYAMAQCDVSLIQEYNAWIGQSRDHAELVLLGCSLIGSIFAFLLTFARLLGVVVCQILNYLRNKFGDK